MCVNVTRAHDQNHYALRGVDMGWQGAHGCGAGWARAAADPAIVAHHSCVSYQELMYCTQCADEDF